MGGLEKATLLANSLEALSEQKTPPPKAARAGSKGSKSPKSPKRTTGGNKTPASSKTAAAEAVATPAGPDGVIESAQVAAETPAPPIPPPVKVSSEKASSSKKKSSKSPRAPITPRAPVIVPMARSGRAAAQKANERIIAKQEVVIGEGFAKKNKKKDAAKEPEEVRIGIEIFLKTASLKTASLKFATRPS